MSTIQLEVTKQQLTAIIRAVEVANTLLKQNADELELNELQLLNSEQFLKELEVGLDLFEPVKQQSNKQSL